MKHVIRTYYPQSVFLPNGVERVVSSEQQEAIGRLLPRQQQAYYDSKTLFYDLFFQSNRLICIGPPFYNLGAPLAIKHNGKNLSFKKLVRINRFRGPEIIYIDIPSQVAKEAKLDLEFVFREFTIEVCCHCRKNISLPPRDLCLTALQKDNPLVWIKDWCRWHIRVHGVQRIVLYDNDSSYWPTLDKELVEIGEEVEVILFHWPYKHGPIPDRLYDYRYAKLGMLNHFRLFFGIQTLWCINLDIDEFLYFDSSLSLKEYLGLPENLMRSQITLAHYLFPSGQVPAKKQARFYHHRIRYRTKYWNVSSAPKYICQPNKVKQMENHGCAVQTHAPVARKTLLSLIKRATIAILKKMGRYFFHPLLNRRKKRLQEQQLSEKKKIFFCHFRDLYNGWYGDMYDKNKDLGLMRKMRSLSSVDPAFLVEDKRVIHKAIEKGVVTELEIS